MLNEGPKPLDTSNEIRYKKGMPYVQWKSDALAWANNSRTKIGDIDYGSDGVNYYFYKAIDPDNDGRATDYQVLTQISMNNDALYEKWNEEAKANNERNHASIPEHIARYGHIRESNQGNNAPSLGERSRNGRVSSVYKGAYNGNGIGTAEESVGDTRSDDKYSVKGGSSLAEGYLSHNEALAISEVNAAFMEKLLSDEWYIKRLCQDNRTLGKRILNKIRNMWERLKGESKEEKELRAVLKQAEKLYNDAIAHAPDI